MLQQLTPTTLLIGVCLFGSACGLQSLWEDHSYFVSLDYKESGGHLCNGALINPRTIIVAASCIARQPNARAKDLEVTLSPRVLRKFNVRDVLIHPNYDPGTSESDVAIVYLKYPVYYSVHTTQNLQLGTVGYDSMVAEVTLEQEDVLNLRLLNTTKSNSSCVSDHTTVCAVSVEADNLCTTNRGGPVIDLYTESLVGIGSFKPDELCNPGEPEGFTRIDLFKFWIDAEIAKLPVLNFNHYLSNFMNSLGKLWSE